MTLHDTPLKYCNKNPNMLSKALNDVGFTEDFVTENLIQYLATADKRKKEKLVLQVSQVVDVCVGKLPCGLLEERYLFVSFMMNL